MRDRDNVDAIKRRLDDPREVARLLGLDGGKVVRQGGGGISVCCPAHGDRSPSLSLTRGADGTLRVKCHAPGCLSGDVYDLVAAAEGLDRSRDFRRVLEHAAAYAGIALDSDAPQHRAAPLPRREPPPVPPPVYPPEHEILSLLSACIPCRGDAEVSAWLGSPAYAGEEAEGRAIDPELVDLHGLALALPSGTRLPRWAWYRGVLEQGDTWPALGYRLVIPMRDAMGRIASLRARAVVALQDDMPKALPPTGFDLPGLVMADHCAALMLQRGAWPGMAQRRLVISEGETDWMTAATHWQDDLFGLACIGIVNGSWTQALADRVPSGSRVIVRTDQDDSGDIYAEHIAATLRGRCELLESDAKARAERRRTRPARVRAKQEARAAEREAARAALAAQRREHAS